MKYRNREMSIENIVQSFNAGKISIIPPFQRRSVWNLKSRQKLIRNILRERPIPAIFLYKDQDGSKLVYNILDGKQRLETLLLFISDSRPKELSIDKPRDYFRGNAAIDDMKFGVRVENKHSDLLTFADLDDDRIAKFREYQIATIEIEMDSEEHPVPLSELIDLFIDINSTGKLVTRFEMVKAMKATPLFKQVLDKIGKRRPYAKKSVYYQPAATSYPYVMQHLDYVASIDDKSAKVDRMWERLTELFLFMATGNHSSPATVLKGFINAREDGKTRPEHAKLSAPLIAKMDRTFKILAGAYKSTPALRQSRLATDQPYFYTMATTFMTTDLIDVFDYDIPHRLEAVAGLLEDPKANPEFAQDVLRFMDLAKSKTTHPNRRKERQALFGKLIAAV